MRIVPKINLNSKIRGIIDFMAMSMKVKGKVALEILNIRERQMKSETEESKRNTVFWDDL